MYKLLQAQCTKRIMSTDGDYFSAFQNVTKFSVGPSANKLLGTVRRNLDGNLRKNRNLNPQSDNKVHMKCVERNIN